MVAASEAGEVGDSLVLQRPTRQLVRVRAGVTQRQDCVGSEFVLERQAPLIRVPVADGGRRRNGGGRLIPKLIRQRIAQGRRSKRLPAGGRAEKGAEVEPEEKLGQRRAQASFRGVVELAEGIEHSEPAPQGSLPASRKVVGKSEPRRPARPIGQDERWRQPGLLRGDELQSKVLFEILSQRIAYQRRSLAAVVADDEPRSVRRVENGGAPVGVRGR